MVQRLCLVLALIVATISGSVSDTVAQTPARLGVVTTLGGAATLTRDAAPDGLALEFRDEILMGDTIRTSTGALVRVLMAGRATLLSIAEQSAVRLTEDADALSVRVETGKVSVVVERAAGATPRPTRIETDGAIATLRGTAVIAEVRDATTTFVVLRGEVEVARRAGGGVTLRAFEIVRVVGDVVGPVEPLTADAAGVALRDFRQAPSARRPSQDSTLDLISRQLLEAEAEVQRRGMVQIPDPHAGVDDSSPTAGQLRTTIGSSRAVVSPQALIPPSLGTPMRGTDVAPGRPGLRTQSP